jgi:hypothetical protein
MNHLDHFYLREISYHVILHLFVSGAIFVYRVKFRAGKYRAQVIQNAKDKLIAAEKEAEEKEIRRKTTMDESSLHYF